MSKRAIIIGADPAGLTAAYELLKRTDIIPVILEKSGDIGGISRTVNIAAGITSKKNIWGINTEQEYHEEKAASAVGPVPGKGEPAKLYKPSLATI